MKLFLKILLVLFLGFNSKFLIAKEWYVGGTLHQSNLSSWAHSTYSNKLATAGDMAGALELSTKMSKLREWAVEIVACIDEVAIEPSLRSMRVSEAAVMCIQILKEDGMR